MGNNLRSFGEGLKRARKKAGYKTQQALTKALVDSGNDDLKVTIDSVQNWEQGKNFPSLQTFLELCKFFDCDADYLLGRIEEKNHDLHYIHDYTGLSERAILELRKLDAATLNHVLVSEHFIKMLEMIRNSAENANNRADITIEYMKSKLKNEKKTTALLEPSVKAGGVDLVYKTITSLESGSLFDEVSSILYDEMNE